MNNRAPAAFGITYSNTGDGSQFLANMKYQQLSFYLQDQMNITDNFRLTAGVRFELPIYPELKNNYNKNFAQIDFDGYHYATDQLPSSYQLTRLPPVSVSTGTLQASVSMYCAAVAVTSSAVCRSYGWFRQ